jgi:glycosyltransferase involved in cell wall biosynthesis
MSQREDGKINKEFARSPSVTYWTGIWEPTREAISKEVAWLRGELAPGSPVVSFTPQRTKILRRERVVRVNFNRWWLLRAAALCLERTADLSHVFGGVGAVAHFLHLLGHRPILLTVVIPGDPLELALYDRVTRFVAESRELAATLIRAGVSATRIDVIYPAVDLDHHKSEPLPLEGRLQLLFASTPSDPAEIDARGLGLLIDLARLRPDLDVVVPWRQWGPLDAARKMLDARSPPPNFKVEHGDVPDMAALYRRVHATVCCFQASYGKSAPNFIVEGLACGRPVLLSDTCGIADLVAEWQAGVVTPRTAEGLAAGVDDLRQHYGSACAQARRLAAAEFDSHRAAERYACLYRVLAATRKQ